MATYDAGIVTAYGAAVRGGYTGTYEEFCVQQANFAQYAERTEDAAERAEEILESIPSDYSELSSAVDHNIINIDDLQGRMTQTELDMLGKVDRGFVREGVAYFCSGDDVLFEITGIGGGGEGGGGSGNNAVVTMTNTTGWIAKTISHGYLCNLSFTWSSIENDMPTGFGSLNIIVNGITKAVRTVQQGAITINISPYLSTGNNSVKLKITDVYDNSRTLSFSITMVALSISSSFSTDNPFTGAISFAYTPTGNVEKTVHFIVDGTEIGTQVTSASGRQQTYVIPAQTHGSHTLRVYFDAVIAEQSILSNELYYDMICVEEGSNTPIIASAYNQDTVTQYTAISIPYKVYDPTSLTAQVSLKVNGTETATVTVDRTEQVWSYRAIEIGELVMVIQCGNTTKSFTIEVTESDIDARAETDDLSLYLTSLGRSNNEEDPSIWTYGTGQSAIAATLSNFNFVSDGWVQDDDNNTVLRVTGNARVSIPYQIFAQDFRGTGKTIEFEFATRDVRDYDAVILSCFSGNRGIKLTSQMMVMKSEQSELDVQYKEDEHVRVSFVVEKRTENRLIYCYLNGIISAIAQYPTADDFEQPDPVGISIGSDYCTTDIYNIRIYDNDLTRYQMLNNWIADTQNIDQMLSRYRHNNVFDEYGQIVISKLPSDLPYLILEGAALPQYKGDKKNMNGSYTDPLHPNKSFTFTGAQVDVQGTSSQYYARKNYKIKFRNGFIIDGAAGAKYAMNDDAIPVNTFCFKADVASSEGANNVELVRLYDSACPYQTPAQEQNSKVRQGIDGFPCVIFWNNGSETVFIGKYNFNNDKSTEDVFGFETGDESWEVKNNTSNRVIWKDDDFSGNDWLNDFEARYPDTDPAYTDSAQLAEFSSFLKSTDRTAATGNTLPESVTYDGVTYTTDTAAYRLAKFKAEIGNYTELQSALFYYLFTELFLMVDSRAKNAFPSFIGEEVIGA